eukprot:scaffold105340_cov69-Phaeocystis_antarctica.AAC.1
MTAQGTSSGRSWLHGRAAAARACGAARRSRATPRAAAHESRHQRSQGGRCCGSGHRRPQEGPQRSLGGPR